MSERSPLGQGESEVAWWEVLSRAAAGVLDAAGWTLFAADSAPSWLGQLTSGLERCTRGKPGQAKCVRCG